MATILTMGDLNGATPEEIKKVSELFTSLHTAEAQKSQWQQARPGGVPSEIKLRDVELAEATRVLDELEARQRFLRGDDIAKPEAATQGKALSTSASLPMNKPLPLTTGDIAYSFAGLHWPTEDKWRKPLGDKPNWLKACVAIPGSRGKGETRWYPVLIGAALVRKGHVKANSVRAKFQTQNILRPWLDAWNIYEADNFAGL